MEDLETEYMEAAAALAADAVLCEDAALAQEVSDTVQAQVGFRV